MSDTNELPTPPAELTPNQITLDIMTIPFESRDDAIKALCQAVWFGSEPVYPDPPPPPAPADALDTTEPTDQKCIDPNCREGLTWITNLDGQPERRPCGCTPPAERPTPITDEHEFDMLVNRYPNMWEKVVKSEVARDIERQLVEAREQHDRLVYFVKELAWKAGAQNYEEGEAILKRLYEDVERSNK